jgi:hypothetical protein
MTRGIRRLWGAGCLLLGAMAAQASSGTDPVLRFEAAAHTGPIRQIAVDRGERLAVTVSDDKTARLWDLQSQELLSIFRVPVGDAKAGSLYGAAISPLGHEVAVAGTTGDAAHAHRIYIFNIKTGALAGTIDALAGDIKSLTWTQDGRYLIATYAGAHGVRIFDRTGTLWHEKTFTGPSYGAAVSATGGIAVAAFDGSIHLFSSSANGIVPAGRIPVPIADPVSVSYSPDGRSLAVGYYSRNGSDQAQVDVLDIARMQVSKTFAFRDVRHGNLMQVAWSRDGTKIHGAGTGYRQPDQFILKTIAWPSGETEESDLAGNSVTKLLALSAGRLAFSTFEPSWGVAQDKKVFTRKSLPVGVVKSAASLRISADGSVVSWTSKSDGSAVTFDLKKRDFPASPPGALHGHRTFSVFGYRNAVWENTRAPQVNGIPIPLAAEEISRAFAVFPDDSAALLGTSWNLRKLDKAGKELWRIPTATEISAINLTDDSRTIVLALADGTIHWLRASDGLALMTLSVVGDGRWVLATPAGYYDAGAGAESLIGWHVNRADGLNADFFPISKFRDRFYRPDVIDQGLRFDAPDAAVAAANRMLEQQTQSAPADQLASAARLLQAKPPSHRDFPPILNLASPKVLQGEEPVLKIDFSMFSHATVPVNQWQVKVNGRPAQALSVRLPTAADGKALGQLSMATPPETALIQLFVGNEFGLSEPLTVESVRPPRPGPKPSSADAKSPTLYVMAIGVAHYADPSLNLLFPAKDARDMANVLKQQEGRHYKKVVSKLLVDQQATREALAEGLTWLRDSPGANDIAILFMAGHGITLPGNVYRFLPHDARLAESPNNFITEEQIRDTLVNIKGKAILFIDTCFSGKATGKFSRHDTKLIANRLSSADSGVIVFSSSDGKQESLENKEWNNGAFTKELIEGLAGKADYRKEGIVTHKGLDYFVSHQVRQLTGGLQTPVTTVPIGMPDYALTSYRP